MRCTPGMRCSTGSCPLGLLAALLVLIAFAAGCAPLRGEAPAGEAPAGEAPAGEAPAGEAPAGEAPASPFPSETQAETPRVVVVPDRLSAQAFVAAVEPGDVVLDVRTPAEFAEGHLTGAVLADITAPDFTARVADLDRARTTYVYCRTGNRSARAADQLRAMGFTRVINVGGLADLVAAGADATGPASSTE